MHARRGGKTLLLLFSFHGFTVSATADDAAGGLEGSIVCFLPFPTFFFGSEFCGGNRVLLSFCVVQKGVAYKIYIISPRHLGWKKSPDHELGFQDRELDCSSINISIFSWDTPINLTMIRRRRTPD